MERSTEARRAGTAVSNGLCRRRNRTTSLRDSPEEDGQVELQETVRLRDREQKKDRDREFSNRNKRRRGERYTAGCSRNEVEESSEESEENYEDDYEQQEEGRITRLIPWNQQSSSSSLSNQSHLRNFAPVSIMRSPPVWKPDEIIGVAIPRKARSASGKRSHDSWVSLSNPSTSPAAQSIDGSPLLSSSGSDKKKIRPIGPKTRLPKSSSRPPSSSCSVQDDIEIEVAEALYDLMKQSQSQSSKKQETAIRNPVGKLDSEDKNDASNKISPLLDSDSKRKRPQEVKEENENSAVFSHKDLVLSVTGANGDQPTKMDTEISPLKFEKKAYEGAYVDLGASQTVVAELEIPEEIVKQEEKFPAQESERGVDKVEASASNDDAPPSAESAFDAMDLTKRKALIASEVETKREAKFEIDLMAPPPGASSPERDCASDLVAGPEIVAQDVDINAVQRTETSVKNGYKSEQRVKDEMVVGLEDNKMETVYVKQEQLKPDLEKPNQSNRITNGNVRVQPMDRKQQQQFKATVVEGEKSAQTSSLPFPITVSGWPGSLPLGFVPSLQSIVPVGGASGSSAALQPPQFMLPQPRPKKCATHHYIARNIQYHQQITKMNHIWPPTTGAPSIYGSRAYNMPSKQGGVSAEKERGSASVSSPAGKEKISEIASIVDAVQKKQLVLQQASQPVPAANLLHAPAFIFPLVQPQTTLGSTASTEVGIPKSAAIASSGPFPGNSSMGALASSSSVTTTASAMSFNYNNLSANEAAPYMAILQNNGYPLPIATHVGTSPPQRGGTHAPAMSFFNGSFYPSPPFHPSQDQQQHFQCQPLVQPAHPLTSAPNGSLSSSSSQKQSQSHYLTSTATQLQQQHQKQHVSPSHSSRKHEADIRGEAQKSISTQNFAVPIQPLNFALMAPVTYGVSGGASNNHGEKQQQGTKGGVELIPPQAFAFSFASFDRSSSASAHNFHSMSQNPAIFQLSDTARYQVAPASQVVQQKSDVKTRGYSINADDGRKSVLGKSTNFGQSLSFSKSGCTDPSAAVPVATTVYDSSSRTLNFVSSPSVTGNQPSQSSLAILPNSQQQQQLPQIQKQHMMQQQVHHQHLSGSTRIKPPTSNSLPASSVAVKVPNSTPAFSQSLMQTNGSGQSLQWKSSVRTPQGQTQISFVGNSKNGTAQGHQIVINGQSGVPLVGSPPNSSISRSSGSSSKTSSQQRDSSSNGPCQKATPVCVRSVPSILSTGPSHLSEIKY
ncbi:hypothetical protein NMG60_11034835 [Bertholletia excelsa]